MITNKFVHIHLPRTGGQKIRGIIKNKCSKFNFFIYNSHISMDEALVKIPKNMKIPPFFCIVRNPWDWYVSRYFFRQKEITRNCIGPHLELEKFGNSVEGFRKHIYTLQSNLDNNERPKLTGKGCPRIWRFIKLSDYYNFMCPRKPDYLGRLENFKNDVASILIKTAPGIFNQHQLLRELSGRYNASAHNNYRNYYTKELKDIIYKWDEEYIKRFNYKFGA